MVKFAVSNTIQSVTLISPIINPLPDNKSLDASNLKEFADNNFKFDGNGGKFSEKIENTVGKGEIAHYEQFLLFPQCFQKTVLQTRIKQGLFGKGLNGYISMI